MEMTPRGSLRASDAEREQVAERLRNACAEGRITPDELDDRLRIALSARTHSELGSVVKDLPRTERTASRRSTGLALVGAGAGSALGLARTRPLLAVAIIIPVVVVTMFIVTGVLALWAIWWIVGFWLFGAKRRALASRGGPGAGRGMCGRPTSSRPQYWV
jgi:hypothetical protein